MKSFSLLMLAFALVSGTFGRWPNSNLNKHWENFKVKYNKIYPDAIEELTRRLIFEENHEFIERHNAAPGNFTFQLAMNHFGDLTNWEYRKIYLGYKPPKDATPNPAYIYTRVKKDEDIPLSIDWRDKGYVTPVKNQFNCGSCWAFSAVGSLEGQHFKATGELVSLSEHNLVDCSAKEGNHGCKGGWMYQAYEYVKDNNGIDTEDFYPYKGVDGKCHYNATGRGATDRSYFLVKSGDEQALKEVVATKGPVSVAIDASSVFFQFYFGGVYNVPWCSSTDLDHGVLIVGYGEAFKNKYWLVKNSWGTGWGIYGYIMMSRDNRNQCGIASQASMPIV